MQFTKASKKQAKLRLALIGPAGSGKTYTALNIAKFLGGRVAVIDTEHGSASKYADLFEFDTLELSSFSPNTYVEAIHAAEAAGYDILIIDSLSHAWMGKEGALEQVDRAAKRSQSQNTYTAWRDVTPMHNAMIDAILQSSCHIIATMRAKTEYVLETNERGKQVPKKVGLAPVQRDGLEYEFDVTGDMNPENEYVISKTRCPALAGQVIPKPGKEIAAVLRQWLTDGAPAPEPVKSNGNGHKPEPAGMVDAAVTELGATSTRQPEAEKPVYSGMTAKIGKNQYPAAWAKALAAYKRANQYEVDGILQKLALAADIPPENVISEIDLYLDQKEQAS